MKKRFLQSYTLKFFYSFFCKFFLKIFVGTTFHNTEVLKGKSQFIIVSNHNSHLDTLTLMAAIPSNMLWKVKPVAAKDYFGKTKFRAALSNYILNTLLIERIAVKTQNPIEKMVEKLDAGYSLIIFPEGTRSTSGQIEKLKSGIAHLLTVRPSISYIPTYLSGMNKTLPKGEFLVLPYKSAVHFGEAKQITSTMDRKQIIEEITKDFEEMERMHTQVIENQD